MANQQPSRPWTVSGLTEYLKERLESDELLQSLWLTGEISSATRSTAGHFYFTLKDANATLSCVMWRSAAQALTWQPQPGLAALAHGYVSIYPSRGTYQLYVDILQPAGLGGLYARFEQLRERLRLEGLFDPARKRPLPPFPRVLGVVTSPQAAALRDVLTVLRRRYPLVQVLLAPTLVQGDQAPRQIAAALEALGARNDVDLVLLVRGGGSLEELWAYNDEQVARAIAACPHPVVSGVGHETDFTIADFVADLRAATPSAAAELAVPDQAELRQRIAGWSGQLAQAIGRRLTQGREAVARQQQAVQRLSPRSRLDARRQQVDELAQRANRRLAHTLALDRSRLAGLQSRLVALSPSATLHRGYAIVRQQDSGAVVRSVTQAPPGERLLVRVVDGEFGAVAGQPAP